MTKITSFCDQRYEALQTKMRAGTGKDFGNSILGEDGRAGVNLRFHRRQFRFQRAHLFQKLVGALGFVGIHAAYGEADMDHHIVAQASLGNKAQGNLAHDPAKLHAGRTQRPQFLNFEDFPWYGKAHGSSLRSQYTTGF